MTEYRQDPPAEAADLRERLRGALEIQSILRDEEDVPHRARGGGDRRAGAKRAPRRDLPAAPPAAPPKEAPPEPPRPTVPPAAPVVRARPAAQSRELFAAPVQHSWQEDPADSASLGELHDRFAECLRCPLGETRTRFVFGVGSASATVMFVGEAPGRDEDLQGEPFVGRAGKLLDKILEAIRWRRDEVYIANILKCRPPGNRNPEASEIAACEPILRRQIELIRPVILCTLGTIAAKVLLDTTQGITRLRGQLHDYRGIPVVATYHPAALLRNPNWKRPTWEDVQMLRREHDRLLKQSDRSPR